MSAQVLRAAAYTASRAWGSTRVAAFAGLEARVHWTDTAYPWHVNDGDELFVVLDGVVDMHWRRPGAAAQVATLGAGDVWTGAGGVEHRAIPRGEARVLVVETPFADTLVDGG
ncbi:cupin domain-containing protein [Lysobacter humi (ex Lee et al. 2017)]